MSYSTPKTRSKSTARSRTCSSMKVSASRTRMTYGTTIRSFTQRLTSQRIGYSPARFPAIRYLQFLCARERHHQRPGLSAFTRRRAGLTGSTDRTQGDVMTDADAHEFYKDPEHLAASAPGQRRGQPMKTGMIPVR